MSDYGEVAAAAGAAGPRTKTRRMARRAGARSSAASASASSASRNIDYINYKDVKLLTPFIPERGKIQPRRISGTCATHQRAVQVAIKRARQLALVPYVTD